MLEWGEGEEGVRLKIQRARNKFGRFLRMVWILVGLIVERNLCYQVHVLIIII